MISFQATAKFNQQAVLLLISENQAKTRKLAVQQTSLQEKFNEILKSGQFHGHAGETFPFIFNGKIMMLLGVGDDYLNQLSSLRVNVRKALVSSYLSKPKSIEIIPCDSNEKVIHAIIEGIMLGTYSWRKYIHCAEEQKSEVPRQYVLITPPKAFYDQSIKICEGTNFARDLINDNAEKINSDYLERVIKSLVKGRKNVHLNVLNKKELKTKGLHLHLAVNQGSRNEPKLIIAKYQGAGKEDPYTAIVGKGMTFDTGGLNLKPTGSIESMKLDMSGAAAVIGTLKNTLALKIKKNVIFVCTIAENLIGSNAYKPGDVIIGYAGKSVEVANTDAEGRLVLADAISYVVKNYRPKRLIDIATLTGACIIALGYDYMGLVTQDDTFSRQLVRSSNETDDRIWRLPSYSELADSVKSKIADIRNLGFPKGVAGALTAAEFLRHFTDGTTWAHLDIAGPSYVENTCRMYYGHGGTGAGVRLLTHYLLNN